MDRPYLYLSFTDFIYVRLKGIIWACNGLSKPNNLEKDAGDVVSEVYSTVEKQKALIIDCKGVSSLTDHSLDELFKSVNTSTRDIIFINHQSLDEKIASARKEFCAQMGANSDGNYFSIFKSKPNYKYKGTLYQTVQDRLYKDIKKYVKESFVKFPGSEFRRLHSTPILSNGEYDASLLISEPSKFFWITIALADKVEEIIESKRIGKPNRPPKLLTVSLRSSPFAGAIALLLGLQLETVDHFGPINKNNEFDDGENESCDYIYIGDFTIGGTEIKISRNFAVFKNSILEHAIVIGSLFESSIFRDFNLHSLVSLAELKMGKYKLFGK